MEKPTPGRFVVYCVDRAGSPWEVFRSDDPGETMKALAERRANNETHYPFNVHGVYDSENEEDGDVEMMLEDIVADREALG